MKKEILKFWKTKKRKEKKNENLEVLSRSQKDEILKVEQTENILKITILKECDMTDFYQEAYSKLGKEKVATLTPGIILTDMKLSKKDIYFLETEQGIYYIVEEYPNLKIIEKLNLDNRIEEKKIELNQYTNSYSITILLHNEIGSTITAKKYFSDDVKNEGLFQTSILDRKNAITKLKELLENLKKIPNIEIIIEINQLYRKLKQLPEADYNPVISSGIISLSRRFWSFYERKLENEQSETLDIILEETKEIVGEIGFCYFQPFEGFSYAGNIHYLVYKEFQNKHYATEALKLLKQVLKKNQFEGDKDLYIAAEINNASSCQVAINNGGKLVYEGEVPEEEILDGIKAVKVYKIEMNENKSSQ